MKYLFIFSTFLIISICGASQGITAPAPLTIEVNATNTDAGNFVVSWPNNTDQILVSVSLDYYGTATLSFPITTSLTLNTGYTTWTDITSIVFYGTRDNINTALAAMTISMGSIKTAVRINIEISQYDPSYVYNPINKHFYKYVTSSAISYASAKSGATSNTFKGKTGYLLTITSQSEQDFINNNISGNNIWLAATDATNEGIWIIDAGPENGITFWQSTVAYTNTMVSAYTAGSTISGQYSNWSTGEPNNADGTNNGEDNVVAKWNSGNGWNDLAAANNSGVQGYVVEISADFPAGSDYTGVYSTYIVHNNDITFTLSSVSGLSSSNTSNYPNLYGGLQINDGHVVTLPTASKINSNKISLNDNSKIIFTDATSKWIPGSVDITNTFIHSPSTNTNPTYWSSSSNWSGDGFYTNALYPTTTFGYHFTPWLNSPQGWSAGANDANQYLILNYDIPAYITGIVTQGRTANGIQFVSNANVDVSLDGTNWTRVLSGVNLNTNVTDAVTTLFPSVVYAKYVKVIPTSSGWSGHITMRLGLIIKSINIITDGLVLHLDAGNLTSYIGNGSTWNDISGNVMNGTLINSPAYNIQNNGYFTFNGSTAQVRVLDNATLEPGTSDWSMEAWFYSTNISGSTVILGKVNNGGASSNVSYMIRTYGSSLYAQMGDGTGTYINSNSNTIVANKWYHVVYVWKAGATKTLETFVNGKSVGTVTHTMTSLLNSSNPLYFGVYNGNEFSQSFTGNIGIIRLYKKALTAQEGLVNFNANRSRYGL
jgi:hypothetical protein